ncbi:uncharacterized protein [Rutidosis leptorrhynchoides]|uniref:uncharacterized protein n=1 Tax=Rutidosis leptorrhynchoides TaxID=125765 RepID=UPI003A98ECBC
MACLTRDGVLMSGWNTEPGSDDGAGGMLVPAKASRCFQSGREGNHWKAFIRELPLLKSSRIISFRDKVLEFSQVLNIESEEMTKSQMVLVGSITPRTPNVSLRVKILSIETLTKQNFNNGQPFLDVILTDREGDRIGLTLITAMKKKYEEVLKEQHIYDLKNVYVQQNNFQRDGHHWNHKSKLVINNKTSVVPISSTDWVGSDGFKFVPFNDLIKCHLPNKHTADVIGRVQFYNREPKSSRSSDDPTSKYINLELKDLDGAIVSCSIWGQHMLEFLTYMKQLEEQQCVVLIIQFGRTQKYQNQLTVTTDWTHTRLFMDANISVVTEFRSRYLELFGNDDTSSSIVPSQTPTLTPLGKPLDEWFNNVLCVECSDLSVENSGTYIVEAEIIAIEPEDIYMVLALKRSCGGCRNNPQVAVRYLTLIYKILRFKVSVRVADADGYATFTLFETQVNKYVTKSAYELLKGLPEDQDQPDELDALNYTVKDATTDDAFLAKYHEQLKCGSTNLSSDRNENVDLGNSTGYTPPKKVIKQEPKGSPVSVKSSTTKAKKAILADD